MPKKQSGGGTGDPVAVDVHLPPGNQSEVRMTNVPKNTGGGSAAGGGFDYQNRVAAWLAVRILAESAVATQWSLTDPDTTLEFIRCETEQPVDDILAGTSKGGLLFFQVKRSVDLSKKSDSSFASAISQFVSQYLVSRSHYGRTKRSWDRPLDPTLDRLILATSGQSSAKVRVTLKTVLDRGRNLHKEHRVDAAASSQEETEVLNVFIEHIKTGWREHTSEAPSEEDLKKCLCLIYVQTLDLEDGNADRNEAGNILRTAVLSDTTQESGAWSRLIAVSAELASKRTGLDRKGLQEQLIAAGILPRAAHGYALDIDKLKKYSDETYVSLADLAKIRCADSEIKINRESSKDLASAAKAHSLLVVGEPGAGKSGALHDLYKALEQVGLDAVFLAADRLEATTLGALRNDLGLDHDLPDVLANWPGNQPGVLIIDALDAARADKSAKVLREVIQCVKAADNRWNVVASIRKFDLRYSPSLRQLFGGVPRTLSTEFVDAEFTNIWHINIPQLSPDEFHQISDQSTDLSRMLESAPPDLKLLLRIPFNVRLVAELIGGGIPATELTLIDTQHGLLTRYWGWRVIGEDYRGDAREGILRDICSNMVTERHLRVERAAITTADPTALNDLLSAHVISEWQPECSPTPDRSLIVFAHHVLFDFAVARLLLAGEVNKTVALFADDPDLCIVVRPSLVFHFRTLWSIDPSRFWELLFAFSANPAIPEFGRLIGPSVCVDVARTFDDIEPLIKQIEREKDTAGSTLSYTVGALLNTSQDVLIDARADPWTELLDILARLALTNRIAAEMCRLTLALLDQERTEPQIAALGRVSRALFDFAWKSSPYQQWLILQSLRSVGRTYATDPPASAELLRRVLARERLKEYGSIEMPALAREAQAILECDPDFVSEIYKEAFDYSEESQEAVPLGSSQILPLTSNRKQDYEMARYRLAEVFPAVLAASPFVATSICIAAVTSHIRNDRDANSLNEELTFEFDSKDVSVKQDHTRVWDHLNLGDDATKILDLWIEHVKGLCEARDEYTLLQTLRIVAEENSLTIFWRRLLKLAREFPEPLGRLLLPVASTGAVLTTEETTVEAAELLSVMFGKLDSSEREKVEMSILSIDRDHRRGVVLGCMPEEHLVTDAAKALLAKLKAEGDIPANAPAVQIGSAEARPYGEEEYLAEQGVPIGEAPNKRIRELETPVQAFCTTYLNDEPPKDAVKNILPQIRSLYDAISTADADGVHPMQRDRAAGVLFTSANRAAECAGLDCGNEEGGSIRQLLLEGSVHELPKADPEYDAQFDKQPSWGAHLPRIEAARGLTILVARKGCFDAEILERIRALSRDPVPAVRNQVAVYTASLYRQASDEMWALLEHFAREEKSAGVVRGLGWSLSRLSGPHGDRVAELAATIFNRMTDGEGADSVKNMCINLVTGLYVWQNQAAARNVLTTVTADPVSYAGEIQNLLHSLRGGLTAERQDGSDASDIRKRTVGVFLEVIAAARSVSDPLLGKTEEGPHKQLTELEKSSLRHALQVLDRAGSQIFFASGAMNRGEAPDPLDEEQRRQLYQDAKPIIERLADVGTASLSHYLLEALETFISVDPPGVFLLSHQVLKSGKKGAYEYDSLAIGTFVKFVERFLAEYRFVFQENPPCRTALIEVLDIFVQAGWSEAQKLTYRLEEIFR